MSARFSPSVKILKAVPLSASIPQNPYLAKPSNTVGEGFSCHAELGSASHLYKRDPETSSG